MKKIFLLIPFMTMLYMSAAICSGYSSASDPEEIIARVVEVPEMGQVTEFDTDFDECEELDYEYMCEEEGERIENGDYNAFYDNGTYKVGITGVSVVVFDQDDREINRFRGRELAFSYCGAFIPDSSIFVVKSTLGVHIVYDLDQMKCMAITPPAAVPYAQDYGLSITSDGKYMYDVELISSSWDRQLTIYNTENFKREKILHFDHPEVSIDAVEMYNDRILVLGFMRGEDRALDHGFVGELKDDKLINITRIEKDEYNVLDRYIRWKQGGFVADMWKSLLPEEYQRKDIALIDYLGRMGENE